MTVEPMTSPLPLPSSTSTASAALELMISAPSAAKQAPQRNAMSSSRGGSGSQRSIQRNVATTGPTGKQRAQRSDHDPAQPHASADQPQHDQAADAERDQRDDGRQHAPALALLRGQRRGGAAGQEDPRGLRHGARAYGAGRGSGSFVIVGRAAAVFQPERPADEHERAAEPDGRGRRVRRGGLDRSGLGGGEDQQAEPRSPDDRARHRRRLRQEHRTGGDQRLDGPGARLVADAGPQRAAADGLRGPEHGQRDAAEQREPGERGVGQPDGEVGQHRDDEADGEQVARARRGHGVPPRPCATVPRVRRAWGRAG